VKGKRARAPYRARRDEMYERAEHVRRSSERISRGYGAATLGAGGYHGREEFF
jgi:hypothetical protein